MKLIAINHDKIFQK